MTGFQKILLDLPKKITQTLNDKKINFIDKKYTLYQMLPEKINRILDGGNVVDKKYKYNLYQIVLVLSDKFAEVF